MAPNQIQERRKGERVGFRGRVEIDLVAARATWPSSSDSFSDRFEADSVNLSEGGMCVRLQQALDIHARVTLRLFPEPRKKPLECAGRVAWVIQRLDLRDAEPFVYDIGVEFVDPPPRLRQLTSGPGLPEKPLGVRAPTRALQPLTVNDRCYVPRLQQESNQGNRWHLIVTVDSVPCFSRRYASEREALVSWEKFKRQLT